MHMSTLIHPFKEVFDICAVNYWCWLIPSFYVNGNQPIKKPNLRSFISIIFRAAYNISGVCNESLMITRFILFLRLMIVLPNHSAELRSKKAGIPKF